MDRVKVENEWRRKGYTCGLWVDPPGQVWEGYVHDTDELFMVVEGRIELQMEGRTFQPKIGEEILIPAKTVHSVRNLGRSTSRWLYGYKRKNK